MFDAVRWFVRCLLRVVGCCVCLLFAGCCLAVFFLFGVVICRVVSVARSCAWLFAVGVVRCYCSLLLFVVVVCWRGCLQFVVCVCRLWRVLFAVACWCCFGV